MDYINYSTPIKITCPVHGEFEQPPSFHLNSTGCPKCSGKTLKTLDQFISEANKKHNNKYDYSLAKYVNSKTKLDIICPIHGKFQQSPNGHIKGQGCPKCATTYTPTTEEFIATSIQVHGDKYDYSEVLYKNNRTKIKIYCKKCKLFFEQTPDRHLKSTGCNKCSHLIRSKKESFEQTIQLDKYKDFHCYTDEYKTEISNIKILCKKHNNIFYKSPKSFLKTPECDICSSEREEKLYQTKLNALNQISNNRAIKIDGNLIHIYCDAHGIVEVNKNKLDVGCELCDKERQIKERIYKKYGSTFDCSQIKYVDNLTPIQLYCNTHSEFFKILPTKLANIKCPKCYKKKPNIKYNTHTFIKQSKIIHKDKDYDYSKVEYVNVDTPVTIICKIHGQWSTAASNILDKCGCPKCGILNRQYAPPTPPDLVVEKFRKIHGDKYSYDMTDYVTSDSKITITCSRHKSRPFKQRVSSHMGGCGCPFCKSSKCETRVYNYLKTLNVSFKSQYKFSDCRNVLPLSFDFAIVVNDTVAGLIEYNGEQHYKIIKWHGSDEKNKLAFEKYQLRDNIKYQYCVDKNIPLLVLKYDEKDDLENNVLEFLKILDVAQLPKGDL